MRVLITRPEREATTLAAALGERGHAPVIAPLFHLQILRPPAGFSAALSAAQAVLLTSANGARALAEASDQRGRPILAVGDTTASTAEGLGFSAVASASGDGLALAELVREKLDPKSGPLVHVSGADIALDFAEALKPDGFEVYRFALYDAREETALPDSARAAIEGRALDAATFFSPRAADLFVRLVQEAGVSSALANVTAIAISPAAAAPLKTLPFKAVVAATRPTRQAVLDEIDRLAATRRRRTEHHERHTFFSRSRFCRSRAAHCLHCPSTCPGAPRHRCGGRLLHRHRVVLPRAGRGVGFIALLACRDP